MATVSIPNSFTNGTAADADEVNQNFNALRDFANNSTVHVDGSKAMTGAFDAGSNKIVNLSTPTATTDAANKSYVDTAAGGTWVDFSPSWSGNLTIGNGTETAAYCVVPGGMWVHGYVTFGSTSSVSGAITQTIPNSQNPRLSARSTSMVLGTASFLDAGTSVYDGAVLYNTTTTVIFKAWNVAGTYSSRVDLSSTVPFTWTTGDVLNYSYFVPV